MKYKKKTIGAKVKVTLENGASVIGYIMHAGTSMYDVTIPGELTIPVLGKQIEVL